MKLALKSQKKDVETSRKGFLVSKIEMQGMKAALLQVVIFVGDVWNLAAIL